jgi:hypothetical protein
VLLKLVDSLGRFFEYLREKVVRSEKIMDEGKVNSYCYPGKDQAR